MRSGVGEAAGDVWLSCHFAARQATVLAGTKDMRACKLLHCPTASSPLEKEALLLQVFPFQPLSAGTRLCPFYCFPEVE